MSPPSRSYVRKRGDLFFEHDAAVDDGVGDLGLEYVFRLDLQEVPVEDRQVGELVGLHGAAHIVLEGGDRGVDRVGPDRVLDRDRFFGEPAASGCRPVSRATAA